LDTGGATISELEFHYDGKVMMKGVLNDKSYPIIWLNTKYESDNDDKYDNDDDKTLYNENKVTTSFLKDFCEKFIINNKCIDLPFIVNDNKEVITGTVPDRYFDVRDELENYYKGGGEITKGTENGEKIDENEISRLIDDQIKNS